MYSGPARRLLTTHTQLIRCYSSTPPRAFVINSQNLSKAQSPRDSRRHVFARFTSDEASKRDGQNTSELTDSPHTGEGSKLGEGSRGEDGSQLAKGSKEDDSIESMLASKFKMLLVQTLEETDGRIALISQTSLPEMMSSRMLMHSTSRPQLPIQVNLYILFIEEHNIEDIF